MFKNPLLFLKLLLFFIVGNRAYSQDSLTTSIANKLALYKLAKSPSTLFLHFDKTIYTGAEDVWFTAYQLRNTRNIKEYHTLSVALIREEDRKIMKEAKYLMDAGLSFGSLTLPDELKAGNYSLIAYTNLILNGEPEDVFVQPITLKVKDAPAFPVTLKVQDAPGKDSVIVLLEGYTQNKSLLAKATIDYQLGDGSAPALKGKAMTSVLGEYRFSFATSQIREGSNTLRTTVISGRDTVHVNLKLPVKKEETEVSFYPEGGYLVEGLPSIVGWEAKNPGAEPVQVTGLLYKNEELVDTIRTNGSGMGHFTVVPVKGAHYQVKIRQNGVLTEFSLPVPLKAGTVMSLTNALAADTLSLKLRSSQPGTVKVLVHNYQQTFVSTVVNLEQAIPRSLRIVLKDLPKGLATVTLLDSLGQVISERIFFSHYDRSSTLTITPGKQEYETRQVVNIKLKLDSLKGQSQEGTFSIACVQDNRMEVAKEKHIDSYYYLEHELQQQLPLHPSANGLQDTEYLKDLLLIKGWRRYKWQEMMRVKAVDTLKAVLPMTFSGTVTHAEYKIFRPVKINGFSGEMPVSLLTDKNGIFAIEREDLIIPSGKRVLLMADNDGSKVNSFVISVMNPYRPINSSLSARLSLESFTTRFPSSRVPNLMIAKNEYANEMKEVLLISRKDELYLRNINNCGDYVCQFNVLNCPVDKPYKIPVRGETYILPWAPRVGGVLQKTVYQGCNINNLGDFYQIPGIYTQKEFYPIDYSGPDSLEQKYVSTLFWQHSVVLNSNKETELSFYTGDIPGRYRIVVQGVVPGDVVYGESYFEVKKKK